MRGRSARGILRGASITACVMAASDLVRDDDGMWNILLDDDDPDVGSSRLRLRSGLSLFFRFVDDDLIAIIAVCSAVWVESASSVMSIASSSKARISFSAIVVDFLHFALTSCGKSWDACVA